MAQSLPTQLVGTGTFQNFGQLPPEIRIRIWQYSIPEPRLIVIKSPFRVIPQSHKPSSLADMLASCHDDSPVPRENSRSWRSAIPPPALLHVSAEARHEALRHYRLSLGVRNSAPRIYIDFERDTLFFVDTEIESTCRALWAHTPDLRLAERLAIVPESGWRVLRWWADMVHHSLREIVFVHGSEVFDHAVPLPTLVEDATVVNGEPETRGNEMSGAEDKLFRPKKPILATLEDSESPTILSAKLVHQRQQPQRDTESPEPIPTELLAQTISTERPTPPQRTRLQEANAAALQRRQDARDELETLMSVLPTLWRKEPIFTTATFHGPGASSYA